MHVLAEMKMNVSGVLIEQAREHFDLMGTRIQSFRLPTWMFCMLKKEPCFHSSNISILGKFCGFTVIDSETSEIATMYEIESCDEYLVFGEE